MAGGAAVGAHGGRSGWRSDVASFGAGRGHDGMTSGPAREMSTMHHRGGSPGGGYAGGGKQMFDGGGGSGGGGYGGGDKQVSYGAGGKQVFDGGGGSGGGGYGGGGAQTHAAPRPSESQRLMTGAPGDPDAKRRRGAELYGVGETGRSGRSISVRTNFYPIRVDPQLRVAQYDLELEPDVVKTETRRRILSEVPMSLVAPAPVSGWATDGAKIMLVANGELKLTPQAAAAGWTYEHGEFAFTAPATGQGDGGSSRGGARRYRGKLTLKRAGAQGVYIDFHHFLSAAGGDARRAQLQVLDIVLKAQASSRCKTLGDAFYDATLERTERPWADRHKISNGLNELWLGYRTANVYTSQGPMLQVDRAASCMLAPIRLSEFILQKLKTNRLELTTATGIVRLSGIEVDKINAKLTGGTRNTKVYSSHRMSADGRRHLMDYVVRGLDKCRCDEAYFQEVCMCLALPTNEPHPEPEPRPRRRPAAWLLLPAAPPLPTHRMLTPRHPGRSAATASSAGTRPSPRVYPSASAVRSAPTIRSPSCRACGSRRGRRSSSGLRATSPSSRSATRSGRACLLARRAIRAGSSSRSSC